MESHRDNSKRTEDRVGEILAILGAIRRRTPSNVLGFRATNWAPARGRSSQMRVLVVDDDADLRRLTTFGLTKAGIEYEEADSISAARALLTGPTGRSFDAVLLDVELPDARGWDFLEELRS